MARIFLSHSSADNFEAVAVRDFLVAEGWDDIFLDIDPTGGIGAAERWERSLHEAASRCEAVVFLVSRAWLGSQWCLREFNLAMRLDKRLFGVLIEDIPIAELRAEMTAWQLVNLARGQDGRILRAMLPGGEEGHVTFSRAGLVRLREGLRRAGLDARFFAWPPESDRDRPPYRGMRPLEAEDAGIFFGREAQVVDALDRLRGLAGQAPPRLLTILGASGAGKSSFMRAGLLPRLKRDDRSYLPLPVIRSETAVMSGETGFVASLEEAFRTANMPLSRAEIRAAVNAGVTETGALLCRLAEAARPPQLDSPERPPTPAVVIAVDQGEEMFLAEGRTEADAFLALLSGLVATDAPRVLVLITIRSDSYEALQTAKPLEGIRQHTFSLPPMAKGAFQMVIEGPAQRLRDTNRALDIEPALTAALLSDVEADTSKDALPLLAFTLERLWREYGTGGRLRLADYRAIGGVKGSIEAAVERAMKAAETDPELRNVTDRPALLRRAIIPWLASVDQETKTPRRRVARLSEIPPDAKPFIRLLVAERLLATDQAFDAEGRRLDDVTVEPAHEALLRQWGLLQDWLAQEGEAYAAIEGIRRASAEWAAHGRAEAWLAHQAGRLEDAERFAARDDFGRLLALVDRDYLAAARATDNARRDRELEEARKLAEAERIAAERQRQVAHRTRIGAIAAAALAIFAVAAAVYGFRQAGRAEDALLVAQAEGKRAELERQHAEVKAQEARLNETVSLASLSRLAEAQGLPVNAVKLALAAWPRKGDEQRPALRTAIRSLDEAFPDFRQRLLLEGHQYRINSAAFSPDGTRVVTASDDETARVWDAETGTELLALRGHKEAVWSAAFSPDGTRIVTASGGFTDSEDNTARVWDAASGAELVTLSMYVNSAAFSPDGKHIVTASDDKTARVWDATTGATLLTLVGHDQQVNSAAFSRDGARLVTASVDGIAQVWDAATGAPLLTLKGHRGGVNSAAFSPDGKRIVTASDDKTARVWDATTGAELRTLTGHESGVVSVAFSPDGTRIVTASRSKTARVWDAWAGVELLTLKGHEDDVTSAAFSPDGNRIVTASSDKTARIWDVAFSAELLRLRHANAVTSARFSPDGTRIMTASDDLLRASGTRSPAPSSLCWTALKRRSIWQPSRPTAHVSSLRRKTRSRESGTSRPALHC